MEKNTADGCEFSMPCIFTAARDAISSDQGAFAPKRMHLSAQSPAAPSDVWRCRPIPGRLSLSNSSEWALSVQSAAVERGGIL